ncbi:uroporphyrinogen-III C-methyltransferase [Clostridium luticellarii]|jgi:uroporphyrinogen III methyltransferase/synthase|uniref:uroporphyrinogen-III C-methyltransferase n=1 Tax=Clostridium luticellarii TaxID=1691940 RepID=A0A2T0BMI8_9CLOT|nr:uroporphyrinogen-III C-methyltransferase [Clostridium luticellarii]MCI1945254.1 uroporphyrinogen-III C-methyltransferase [Clostridium luticellarii]MCI1968994.1 uroporphyrinogen-III C-methyltransferase [Clostridium luticellarii]MCI1994587.1 uroporphyrinogen-III C-methyltransferase [Clostridium luticellarii]MCI2038916.1 uroporphyrinogen-III C-methyltransferase [Clostridium luticellarii]PRR85094.1 Uroporphyrinogen-III C-methyltransferase [Clostridium luticellarii]
MGKVYLIGAGPGEEELITLKAVRKLGECTAVMYDRLAGSEVLKYLNDNCKVYYCGKEPGCHYKSQDEINDMLIKLAKEGHTVGRIKGGDPYIFGRGGEEALALLKENIEFEVIPGITSPISVLNYAGIPVTHRKISRSFHVFTGKTADKLNIDWNAAAKIGGTLIFLMGFKNLDVICGNLIKNGMDKNTPCAVVMRGTTSKQRKIVGKLQDISEKANSASMFSPCIIVIGKVVEFSDQLNWYEKKPLFGRNICITRSKAQSGEMRRKLLDLGAQVTEIHSIEIKYTSENIKKYMDKLSDYDYIVFTSVNGVNSFFDRLLCENYDVRRIRAKFAAIGPATKKAISQRGIIPEMVAEKFVAESLHDKMKDFIKRGDRIFIPRSKNARPYLAETLRREGCIVDECYTYETVSGKLTDKDCFQDVDTVIFTSPTTVKNMINLVGIAAISKKEVVAIGPITGKELEKHHIIYDMSGEYTTDGIIKTILNER